MRNFLFMLLTYFSLLPAVAQPKGEVYNSYVNNAELYITDGQYQQALSQYEQAFETGTAFTADLYNAAVCAIKLNSKDKILKLADKLADKGVGESFFDKNIFKEYLKNQSFKKICAKAEKVKQQYNKTNKTYTEKLEEFVALDRGYNKLRLTKYSEHYGAIPDTLEMLFRTNTRNLFNYVKEHGFYTEEKIGASVVNDTIVSIAHDADVVFLHYLEMGNDQQLLHHIKNLYVNNLKEGRIPPSHISSIVRMTEHIFGDVGEYAYKIYHCKLYKMNKLPEPEKVARNRKQYLLGSIDDYGQKLAYRYSENKDFIFNYALIGGYIDEEFLKNSYTVLAEIADCNKDNGQ